MFSVKWTKSALLHLAETLKYWDHRNKSSSYSKNVWEELVTVEKIIAENPQIGDLSYVENVRSILILRYFSIFYRIKFDEIEIVAFWDNRRNPENLEI